jgi:hypothetical protein
MQKIFSEKTSTNILKNVTEDKIYLKIYQQCLPES